MDTVQYTKNQDGTFEKVVVCKSTVKDMAEEIGVLKEQMLAFQVPADDAKHQAKLDAAIQNYSDAILILKS